MLIVKVNETELKIKDSANEFLIGEYEDLAVILNDDKIRLFERYFNIFVKLGVDSDFLDYEIGEKTFLDLIKAFRGGDFKFTEFTKEIEVNGRLYQSHTNDEFFLNVKDMKLIEKFISKNSDKFVGELIAVIFKDVDLTKTEHYDPAHIKHKAKLFRDNITFDVAIPFLAYVSKQVIETLTAYQKEDEIANS